MSLASRAYAADEDILDDLDAPAPADKAAPSEPDPEPTSAPPTSAPDAPSPAAEEDKDAAKTSQEELQKAPASLDRIKAVPRKVLLKKERLEFAPFISVSANDSYYQHLAFSASAIFYPHDAFGIGVGADLFYAHISNDTVDDVRENLTSVPAVFDKPRLFAHVDAYWTPVYGKISIFDDHIIHFDFYTIAGMGLAVAGDNTPIAGNVGLGQRFSLSDWFALRFEVRDHLYLDTQTVSRPGGGIEERSDIQSYVMFQAGISVFVPPSFEYSY